MAGAAATRFPKAIESPEATDWQTTSSVSILGTLDECHPLAQIRKVTGAVLRPLLMTGSLSLTYPKLLPFRLHQPAVFRRQLCCPRCWETPTHAGRLDLTSTGGSGSSSDGSDTSTNPPRKPPGSLRKKDFRKFVRFFRQASPYIEGHREKTFVIVIPGEVDQHYCMLPSDASQSTLCQV